MRRGLSSAIQVFNPALFNSHHFGLAPDRWKALRGKRIWITGAGTGYGRALSIALAAAGAEIFLTGRRLHKLEETVAEVESQGIPSTSMHCLVADITDPDQVRQAIAEISSQGSSLYGLVNNAALPQPRVSNTPLLDMTLQQWNALIATNVSGQWWVTKDVLPRMIESGEGRILFISSNAGWAFTAGVGAYNVTKAALNNLSASFAAECQTHYPLCDLQINVLVPGEALTEMNQGSTNSPYSIVPMALLLLSQPAGGPSGNFFHSDGREHP